ncbi:MAG: anthranilate phosphoribosyltransferase [Bryobacteraceae bacterium]|nr:anthranilate phosphoribosyltransferase [Bryobacteraceae bacterium]
MSFLTHLHTVISGKELTQDSAREAMLELLSGGASTAQIAAFLVALKMKGETAGEIAGFARAMREKSERVDSNGAPVVDTCGTGGDGLDTFNVSTVAAFVMAGAGAVVAKHGNRSISSRCGSADVLEEMGVRIDVDAGEASRCLRELGIAFFFAPRFHPAMRHAQPARVDLKLRTVFNLLGPLANPAGARYQVIGTVSPEAAELMAGSLASLGAEHAFVVHGLDGLDEVSTTGPTLVFEVRGSSITKAVWTPEDFGLKRAMLSDLAGGDRARNAEIAREILAGRPGPRRDLVLANSAAGLLAAGLADAPRKAVRLAADSIDSGRAGEKLRLLGLYTRGASEDAAAPHQPLGS